MRLVPAFCVLAAIVLLPAVFAAPVWANELSDGISGDLGKPEAEGGANTDNGEEKEERFDDEEEDWQERESGDEQ